MRSGRSEAVSESGIGWLRYAVSDRTGWIFREQPSQDKGVDAHLEEVVDGKATGRLIGVQVKSGMSWLRKKSIKSFLYRGDFEHLAYWRAHTLPILVVLFNPQEKEAYWQFVSQENIRETKKGWVLSIPFTNKIGKEAVPDWTHICSPESRKAYLRKRRKFSDIASSFEADFDRRQTLLYEALHQTTQSLFVSTPLVNESIFSVLDFLSVKYPVRLIIGPEQSERVWRLISARAGQTLALRVCPSLHLKQVIFDSLLLMSGSANLTSYSLHHAAERFQLLVDEVACQAALERFFDLWGGCVSPVFDALEFARSKVPS
nr:DUF4365 domain-containing protein [uncultured Rhodopila sp.]